MKNRNRTLFLLTLIMWGVGQLSAQQIGIKSNVSSTINLGVEFSVSNKWSIDIPVNYNPWNWDNGMHLKHFAVQPEIRYWFCQKFNAHFVGVHTHYSLFNVGNLPFNTFGENLFKYRYEGYLFGAGLSYGYQWALSKRWGIELTAGLGYARIEYKKYPCGNCGNIAKESHKNYVGPTKLGVSFIYLIQL